MYAREDSKEKKERKKRDDMPHLRVGCCSGSRACFLCQKLLGEQHFRFQLENAIAVAVWDLYASHKRNKTKKKEGRTMWRHRRYGSDDDDDGAKDLKKKKKHILTTRCNNSFSRRKEVWWCNPFVIFWDNLGTSIYLGGVWRSAAAAPDWTLPGTSWRVKRSEKGIIYIMHNRPTWCPHAFFIL